MALSTDDKREIREELWKGLKEFYAEQDLTIAQHTRDHLFVYTLRKSTCTIRKASLWTITVTVVCALAGLVWGALTGKF